MRVSYEPLAGTITASEQAAGYEAANLGNERVARQWRSTTTGTVTVDIDLGVAVLVETLHVHGTNCASIAVAQDTVTPPAQAAGTIVTAVHEPTGRRAGRIYLGVTARYIRLTFAGTPTDGAAYWWAGAIHLFSRVLTLPRGPALGATLTATHPRASKRLPNGRTVTWTTGEPYVQLRGRIIGIEDLAAQQAIREAKTGLVLIDTESRQDMVWPMRQYQADATLTIGEADELSLNLFEAA